MNLMALVESVIQERTKQSEASKQAQALGLTYDGYGYYKDSSGKRVAKTVDGHLVKLEDQPDGGGEKEFAAAANTGGETPSKKRTAPEEPVAQAAPEPEQDSYTQQEPEAPETEENPENLQKQTVVDRMLNAANGDYMKVKKSLVKKIRDTDSDSAKHLLQQVNDHEKAHEAAIKASLDSFDKKRAAEVAARKAKYMQMTDKEGKPKYQSPQI